MCFISSFAVNVSQNLLVNNLFLSVINSFDSLWLLINFCSIIYINTDAVTVFLKNINMIYFVNQLTIIKILSNVMSHAEFFDDDNFTMKFIIINVHEAFNTFSCVTLLYCLLWSILFHQQKLHFAMYYQTFLQQFWTLHLHQTKSLILLTFRCLLILVLWYFLMILSSFCETSSTWWVIAKSLVKIFLLFFLRIFLWVISTLS